MLNSYLDSVNRKLNAVVLFGDVDANRRGKRTRLDVDNSPDGIVKLQLFLRQVDIASDGKGVVGIADAAGAVLGDMLLDVLADFWDVV